MSRSTSRRRSQEDAELTDALVWLLIIIGWPIYQQIRDWLGANQWAIPFAIAITAMFVLGSIAFLITFRRMQAEEKRCRLITTKHLMNLTPSQFEEYVAEIFRAKGYQAKVTGGRGDGGIDIILSKGGEQAIVQCKRFKPDSKIGVKDMREFSAVLDRHKATHGHFVTTSSFTNQAFSWGKSEPITMINSKRLLEMIKEVKFGIYADPKPKPPLIFNAWQWLTLTLLGTGALATIALLITMVIQP